MGVTGLWSILCPVKKRKPLSSLRGQTVAVDLSIWVCESQGVRQMQNRVLKPHLRNLFFRISTLLQLGIIPVFVIEGEATALKHEEMGRRLQSRHKGVTSGNSKRKFGRGRLQGLLKECCELLDTLGVPYVQSQGEAESTCAALNAAGLVDACVSDDGDCFLYGARVVYRNLTTDAKDPHVESFSMEDVTSDLSLSRERLVALALLLGCDYCPAGVPGVGESWAVKLMESLAAVDVLKRFRQWKSMTASDCVDSTEAFVWRRASALPDFPPQKVIEEFLTPKDPMLAAPPQWHRPCILKMMRLGSCYLEWPEEYSLEKTLPLTTLWDLLHILDLRDGSSCGRGACLKPCRIVKRRVRQGVPCFEVEWENNIKGVVDESGQPRRLVTLEQEERFQACFPALVHTFDHLTQQLKAEKTKRGRKTRAQKDVDTLSGQPEDVDTLSGQLDSLTIGSQHGPAYHSALAAASCQSQQPQAYVHERLPASVDDGSALPRAAAGDFHHVVNREGETSQRVTGRESDSMTSPSVINRSVEYVPLSQRLDVLVEGESTRGREDGEIVDLDQSYIYIPLSQRLKARLGSQLQKSTSSSSSAATSLVTCAPQDIGPPALDCSLSYVPLSQRLKHSLDSMSSVEEVCVGTSLPEASEVLETFNLLTTSESGFDGEFVRKSGTDSSVCKQNGRQPVTRVVTEGGTGRQSGTPNTETKSVVAVHTDSASKTCTSDYKAGQSGHPVQESVSDSMPVVQEFSSHIRDNVPDSDDSGTAVLSSPNNADCGLPSSCSAEEQSLNNRELDSAVGKRRLKKKVPLCQRGGKGRTCSQTVKKISVTDLLEDWSDAETTSTDCGNGEPVITISSDESDQERNVPVPKSHGDHLLGSLQPETNKTAKSCFSPVDRQPESPPSALTGQSDIVPPASTPRHTNVPETQLLNSVCQHTPGLSLDGDSFVSDGHFTLHHTLFTSLEESDAGTRLSSGAERHVSQLSCLNTTASSPQVEDQQATDFVLTESPSLCETSELEINIPHNAGEPSQLENRPVLPDMSSVSDGPASRPFMTYENPSEEHGIQAADPVPPVQQLSKDAEDSKQGESIDDGCCFLSLSQRLRLKKSNAKALSAMSNMS